MRITIRNSVFETNSSSCHSFTVSKREKYMNWKLENYRGEKIRIGDEKYHKFFEPELLRNKIVHTSGCKLCFLIACLGEYLECLEEKLFPKTKKITKDNVFNLPFMRWLKEIIKEFYQVELNYDSSIDYYPYINCIWLEESPYDILGEIMEMTLKDGERTEFRAGYVESIFNDEKLFKNFVIQFLNNEEVVIVDEYEEW